MNCLWLAAIMAREKDFTPDSLLAALLNAGGDPKLLAKHVAPRIPADPSADDDARLGGVLEDGQDALEQLSPDEHTYGRMVILSARLRLASDATALAALQKPLSETTSRVRVEQLHACPGIVSQFSRACGDKLHLSSSSDEMRMALERLHAQLSGDYRGLTGVSGALLKEYMRRKDDSAATALVDATHVSETDFRTRVVQAVDMLDFLYLAGDFHLSKRRLDTAIDAFETCLCLPTEAAHSLQIAAFKRALLVRLIRDGRTAPQAWLLSNVSATVRSSYVRESEDAYVGLADLYERRQPEYAKAVERIAEMGRETYERVRGYSSTVLTLGRHSGSR